MAFPNNEVNYSKFKCQQINDLTLGLGLGEGLKDTDTKTKQGAKQI